MYFPTAGIEVFPLWPALCAFGISFFCSMTGVSGAFLLLPYQISILGYIQPGVSATNQIFNVLACPAGVWRYAREGRLLLPLTLFIAAGTLPGVFLGAFIRIYLLPEIHDFMLFVAAVLLYTGFRLIFPCRKRQEAAKNQRTTAASSCHILSFNMHGFSFTFQNSVHNVRALSILGLSFAIGIIGGAYGIGGGAMMVPFLVSFFGLPLHAIAGASLFATFLTSIAGVIFYTLLAFFQSASIAAPDWLLGLLLGAGGIAGMYCGASMQKFVSPGYLRMLLLAIIFFIAIHYFLQGIGPY